MDKNKCALQCQHLESYRKPQDELEAIYMDIEKGSINNQATETAGQTLRGKSPVKTCIIKDCNKKSKARGLCNRHYGLWQKGNIKHPAHVVFAKKAHTLKITPERPNGNTQVRPVDWDAYPNMKQAIQDLAETHFLPFGHIVVSLIGEALSTRLQNVKQQGD
jgi:hypothetical protein